MSAAMSTACVSRTIRTPVMAKAPAEIDQAVRQIAAGRSVLSVSTMPLFTSALDDGYGGRMAAQVIVTVVVAEEGQPTHA